MILNCLVHDKSISPLPINFPVSPSPLYSAQCLTQGSVQVPFKEWLRERVAMDGVNMQAGPTWMGLGVKNGQER